MDGTIKHDDIRQKMESLFKTFYGRLYVYVHGYLDDEERSKDVVSEVFAFVYKRMQEGERSDISSTYLYMLARNKAIDVLRHDKVKSNYAYFVEHSHDLAYEDPMEYEQRILTMREVVDQIKEPHRSVLECCYFRQKTYKETASILDMSENMVKKRMAEVLKMLRRALNAPKK